MGFVLHKDDAVEEQAAGTAEERTGGAESVAS